MRRPLAISNKHYYRPPRNTTRGAAPRIHQHCSAGCKKTPGKCSTMQVSGCLPELIGHEGIARKLLSMHWTIKSFEESKFTLLTSDRPVCMTSGIDDDRCTVFIPLAPRLAFFAS